MDFHSRSNACMLGQGRSRESTFCQFSSLIQNDEYHQFDIPIRHNALRKVSVVRALATTSPLSSLVSPLTAGSQWNSR